MKKTIFVVGVHGNEQAPVRVIRKFKGKVNYVVAHKLVLKKRVRFIETDLNRSFPGNSSGALEERLAAKLLLKLKKADEVVDIHTATCSTPPFLIMTKLTKKHFDLVKRLEIKRVVYMKKSIASGRALIDHVNVGVTLEAGYDKSKKTKEIIDQVLDSYRPGKKSLDKKEYFSVFTILKKREENERLVESIKSFRLVKRGAMLSHGDGYVRRSMVAFYPILPREKSYKRILCLAARRVTLRSFIGKGVRSDD